MEKPKKERKGHHTAILSVDIISLKVNWSGLELKLRELKLNELKKTTVDLIVHITRYCQWRGSKGLDTNAGSLSS